MTITPATNGRADVTLTIEAVRYPPEMTTARVLIRAVRDGREITYAFDGREARQLIAEITAAVDEYARAYPNAASRRG